MKTPSLPLAHVYATGSTQTGPMLLLHGTDGNGHDLLLAAPQAPSWNVLSPRGIVRVDGMLRFSLHLGLSVFGEADVVSRLHELAAFLDEVGKREKFDNQYLVAVGRGAPYHY